VRQRIWLSPVRFPYGSGTATNRPQPPGDAGVKFGPAVLAAGRCRGMADTPVMTDLGRVTVTGGSGFLGANLVSE